jgi:hypothetical protein
MAITNATIGTGTAAAYTSSGSNAITSIIICNTQEYNPSLPAANIDYLYMYAVPSAGSISPPDANTLIINKLPIPAGETVSLDQEKLVFENGDKLVAKCTNGYLVATVSTLAV